MKKFLLFFFFIVSFFFFTADVSFAQSCPGTCRPRLPFVSNCNANENNLGQERCGFPYAMDCCEVKAAPTTPRCESINGICGASCGAGYKPQSTYSCGGTGVCCTPDTTTVPAIPPTATPIPATPTPLPSSSNFLTGYCSGDCVSSLVSCDSNYNDIGKSSCNITFKCCVRKNTPAPSSSSSSCQCDKGKYTSGCGEDAGTPCGENTGGRPPGSTFQCSGQKTVQGDTVEYACNNSCSGGWSESSQTKTSCGNGLKCCYRDVPSDSATKSRQQSGGTGGGSGSGSSETGGGGSTSSACPANGDSCFYTEGDKCYSGTGAKGINKDGCVYSCGPVDSSNCKEKNSDKKSKPSGRKSCTTPGEAVNSFDNLDCPKGKKGTCGGHSYCVYDEDGNYESEPICETEKETCSDKDSNSSSGNTGGSCKDNPTSPPDGYVWKNSCKSCSNNDDCPRNTKDGAVNPDTSNWCFGGSCLMLETKSGGSKDDDDDDKKEEKEKEKKKKEKEKKEKEKKKKEEEKKKKEKEKKKQEEKSERDKAQKEIDKINKERKEQGLPTLTPLPPDNNANTPANTDPSPTPLPPLAEPTNWQGFCGQTTDPARPWGIRVSWDAVPGAPRYAVRIDEDAPSWEGDTPSVGDTVDNQVKETAYVRVAKPGAVYQWWVHSVNASGIYSGLTKKLIIKCPELTTASGTPVPQTVGAGQLIVLPQSSTAVPAAATPTPKK